MWARLLPLAIGGHDNYFMTALPPAAQYPAAITNVVLFAAGIFLGIQWLRLRDDRVTRAAAHAVFLALLLVATNALRLQVADGLAEQVGAAAVRWSAALGGAAAAGLFAWRSQACVRFALAGVRFAAPFVALTFAQALWAATFPDGSSYLDAPTRAESQRVAPARVVWMIFDELDQRVVFEERPDGLALPELDRLRAESVEATAAYPPSGWTSISLPALLTGRLVRDTEPRGPRELRLWLDGEDAPASWTATPTVFSRLREGGHTAGIAGWRHPYCRVLGNDVNDCTWTGNQPYLQDGSYPAALLEQARLLSFTVPLVYRLTGSMAEFCEQRVQEYLHIRDRAEAQVADPTLALVFLHFPIPHLPGIYDPGTGGFRTDVTGTYEDNLPLVDQTLGALRRRMEAAGEWDRSWVIVSADHWRRVPDTPDHRVPFLVKTPAGSGTYDAPLNTLLTHDLVLAVLAGELRDSTDLVRWLDANRTIAETPYTTGANWKFKNHPPGL